MGRRHPHSQVQTKLIQLFPNFRQGRLTKIAYFQQLVFVSVYQVTHGVDIFRLETIAGPNRQIQLRQAHIQLGFQRCIASATTRANGTMNSVPQLGILNKGVQMLAEDLQVKAEDKRGPEGLLRPHGDLAEEQTQGMRIPIYSTQIH